MEISIGIICITILLLRLTRCRHEYLDFKEINIYGNEDGKMPTSCKIIQKCSKCGNIKTIKIKGD